MRLIAPLGLFLCVAAQCPAQPQPVVLPDASLATQLGGNNNNIPFSWTPTRAQHIYENKDVGLPGLFRALQLRPATGFGNPSYGGQMIDLSLLLGETPVSSFSPSSSFAANNPNPIPVLPRTWVLMPLFRAESPSDWQVSIPFEKPFLWSGQNNLCVEPVVWGNTNGNAIFTYPLDFVDSATKGFGGCQVYGDPLAATGSVRRNRVPVIRLCFALTTEAAFTDYGTACAGSGGKPPLLFGVEAPRIGATFTMGVRDTLANAPLLLLLGLSRGSFLGLPLPLDLSGAGLTLCSLNTSILLGIGAAADPAGKALQLLAVPNDPTLVGSLLYFQWIAVDAPANPAGLVTSQGAEIRLGV